MLGILSTYEQTGFYYNADKVVNIPLAILSGIGTVLLPRMSALTQEKNYKAADNLFIQTISGIAALSIAMGLGIASVAKDFVPLFFGQGYEPCILLIYLFAPVFIIKSFSHISSTQFLIPRHQEKNLTAAICMGAVANLICNVVLIPTFGALGATIGTLMAELIACIWQFKFIIPVLSLNRVFCQAIAYLCIGGIMFGGATLVHAERQSPIFAITLKIIVGSVIYLGSCALYWKITRNPLLLQLQQYWENIKNEFYLWKKN